MPGVFTKALRQAYLLFGYTAGLSLSLWLSFLLRFDFAVAPEYLVHFEWLLITIVAIKLLLLLSFGQFGSLLSYFGFYDLGKILVLCAIASGLALALWFIKGVPYAPPRAVVPGGPRWPPGRS
ncbi:MAG: hypothetical protein WCQ44_12130, partial [Opitutaceae bacterium]